MRACCNKKEDNFITYHSNREKEIERVREWEKENPEKRKEYTIKYYKTEKGHRKRLAQQKRYREKKKLIKENEKLKNDKMELLKKIDNLQQENEQLKIQLENRTKQYEEVWDRACNIDALRNWLEGMLDDEKDIFSVIRVKDILDKLSELEGIKYEKV